MGMPRARRSKPDTKEIVVCTSPAWRIVAALKKIRVESGDQMNPPGPA
jgi:hypothetical protein